MIDYGCLVIVQELAILLKVLDSYDGCGVAEAAEQPGNSQAGR